MSFKKLKELQIPVLGRSKPYLGKEDDFQKSVANYLRLRKICFIHAANGGKRILAEAKKLKAMGVSAGFPDLAIFDPTKYNFDGFDSYSGLIIELKVDKGKVSPYQVEWLKKMKDRNFYVAVCFSIDSVIDLIDKLYGKHKPRFS